MQLGPVIGTIGTVVGMVRAFNQLHLLEPGSAASPSDIISSIGLAMYTTAIGVIFAIIGVPFLVTALSKRAEFLRPSLPPGESAPPLPGP